MAKTLTAIIIIACFFFIGFIAGYKTQAKGSASEIVRDTLVIVRTDTVAIASPRPVEITKIKYERFLVRDTVRIADTLFVELPIERKIYADTNFRAVVSGINPKLDSLSIFSKTIEIRAKETIIQKKKHGFYVGAGAGVYYGLTTKKIDAGIGVSVGYCYNF